LLLLLGTLFFLQGCAARHRNIIYPDTIPYFQDDGDVASLRTALARHSRYLNRLDQNAFMEIGGTYYSAAWLAQSLAAFQDIIDLDLPPAELDRMLRRHFTVYQAGGRGIASADMLVTGYYEPMVPGSLTFSPPFIYPLYAPPHDLVERMTETGSITRGRVDGEGKLLPYWTREEIEGGNLLQGHELVYLEDRFDAFLFHVQGSGKIKLPDGTSRSLQYRTNNGHSYSSIGKLLVDEKKMLLEEVDTAAIKRYLKTYPDEFSRILNHNRRFIFFGWANDESPRGSMGEMLTPGRSVAIDKAVLPVGAVGYLVSRKPVIDENGQIGGWVPLRRFVLPQDAGAAIKGSGRVDLFWGGGGYAEAAAGAMKEAGSLYFLVKNTKSTSEADND
jgi:membrane-bound lytic murein transglycosylase A